MPFTARDAATIRATILANRRARYLAKQKDLDVRRDSDAYSEADAYALEQELLEQRALALTAEFFPDTASDATLLRHAALIGLARKAASFAVLTLTATGVVASTWLTSNPLVAPDGAQYSPTAGGAIGGGGTGVVTAQAQVAGAAGNTDAGSILTWVSAPAGINPQATVAALATVGADLESIDDLKVRVLDWWRERPGGGNRADFRAWALSRAAIYRAFVHPLTHLTLGPGTLGAVRVLLLGEPSARTAASPLGLGTGNRDDVRDYIKGTGAYALDGGQIPGMVAPSDIDADLPATQAQPISVTVINAPDAPFPFSGTYTTAAGSTTTVINVTTNPTTPGATQVNAGDRIAVRMPAGIARGEYVYATVAATASGSITVASPMPTPPVAGVAVRPAASNCEAILASLLAIMDRLGPGDVNTGLYPDSARWPVSTTDGPFTLYVAAIVAGAMGVPGLPGAPAAVNGVVSATVSVPGADVVPPAFTVLIPGEIIIDGTPVV